MRILTHICCGPCAIYPIHWLRENNFEIIGYFFNPNIHPYREFKKRISSLAKLGEEKNLQLEVIKEYGLTQYLRKIVFKEKERCEICVEMRLDQTALKAKEMKIKYFTTTLLYSKYQKHQQVKEIGEKLAEKYELSFVYHDFREGWQTGIDQAIELDLYRQPYCGCIYSEQERYDKKYRKTMITKKI